jgi:hypothetical protein
MNGGCREHSFGGACCDSNSRAKRRRLPTAWDVSHEDGDRGSDAPICSSDEDEDCSAVEVELKRFVHARLQMFRGSRCFLSEKQIRVILQNLHDSKQTRRPGCTSDAADQSEHLIRESQVVAETASSGETLASDDAEAAAKLRRAIEDGLFETADAQIVAKLFATYAR